MISPASPAEVLERHTLVDVSAAAWRRLVESRDDLAAEPVVADWVDRGWPLISRRPGVGESEGLALGLPLPPSLGKHRIAVVLQPDGVTTTRPPPLLDEAWTAAPPSWAETIERLSALAASHAGPARVFGSLAWQWITGLPYLTLDSDLDVLLSCASVGDIDGQATGIAEIEATAPMRIDGELVRPDGSAVNWREVHARCDELLVKHAGGVALVNRKRFLGGLDA